MIIEILYINSENLSNSSELSDILCKKWCAGTSNAGKRIF